MTSSENRIRAEEWYDRNIFQREQPSLEYEEEIGKAREKFKAYQNLFVREHGETFLSNIDSAKLLLTTPFETYIGSVFKLYFTHIKQMQSPNEFFGGMAFRLFQAFTKKSEEEETIDLADLDPERRKAKEFWNLIKELKSGGGDPKALLELIRTNVVDTLAEKPELIEWSNKLFEATLCSIWTSYEVLGSDLWESLVNNSTEAAQNAANFEPKSDKDDPKAIKFESKKIDLNTFFQHGLNLNGKMGTLLKDKFDFTGESGIRTAYDACFIPKADRQNKAERDVKRNIVLYATEQKRHVIMHNGGVFDKQFVDHMRIIGSEHRIGDKLNLCMPDLEESMEGVFKEGCKLLDRSETWLNNQKKIREMNG